MQVTPKEFSHGGVGVESTSRTPTLNRLETLARTETRITFSLLAPN